MPDSRNRNEFIESNLLVFLWRWKMCTTAGLSAQFFPALAPHSAYKRIHSLRQRGYICVITYSLGNSFLWALTRKGFDHVKTMIPPLKDIGFKSECIEHDHVASSFHIGDFILGIPNHIDVFTEQELRRHDDAFYPEWIPRTTLHRPDGYTVIRSDNEDRLIAFEVELSIKKESDYLNLGRFYRRLAGINNVLWLVKSDAIARRLNRLLSESENSKNSIHCFFLRPEFQKSGWGAICKYGGHTGVSIRKLLGTDVGAYWDHDPTMLLLDTRKCRTNFKSYGLKSQS